LLKPRGSVISRLLSPYSLPQMPASNAALRGRNNTDKYMPRGGRRSYKLTDLFTNDELDRVAKLFIECRNTREDFR
jgi:hypothetical protein